MFRPLGVSLALLAQASLIGWEAVRASPNKTEVGHIAASVYFWHTLRFDVFRVNPPLTRIIAGLPVVLCGPECDWNAYSSRPQERAEWPMGSAFIVANAPEKVWWCFVLARWSLIPILLIGGYFGYCLSRELYGPSASFVFLAFWCFSPFVLAWGATICPDASAGALGLAAIYALRRWLAKADWTRTAVAGVSFGLLPLTKTTWLIAFALWPILWFVWAFRTWLTKLDRRSLPLPPCRQLATVLLLGLYTLNMGYLFDGTFRQLGQYVFRSELFCGREVSGDQGPTALENRFAGTWLGTIPVPLPADFVQGIDTQRYDFEQGLPSYLRGEWADHGWWYYYLYALAVKEPLGTWCLLAFAIGATILGRGYSAGWRDEMLVLSPFLVLFAFVSSQTGFSVHSRYILPALPLLFVWISKVGRVFEMHPLNKTRLATAAAVAMALAWSVVSSLSVYPHSLSYFNELAVVLPTPFDASYPTPIDSRDEQGGLCSSIREAIGAGPRNGPRHLLDSNIDWGQDLFYLEDWCQSHPEARPIQVAYFGSYPLGHTKIESSGTPPPGPDRENLGDKTDSAAFGPLPGWYAVSANEIYDRSKRYRYFLNFKPVATAGYSIYIYHITLDDANRVRKQLGLPEWKGDEKQQR